MRLRIATCCYNALPLVRATVESILQNTRGEFELVLVYNHAPDSDDVLDYVRSVAAADARVVVIDPLHNSGCHGGVNLAWESGEADYYAKVDDDTTVPAGWDALLIACLESEPRLAFIAADNNARSTKPEDLGEMRFYGTLGIELHERWVSWSAMMVPARIYREFGPLVGTGVYSGEEHVYGELAFKSGRLVGYALNVMATHADIHGRELYVLWKFHFAFTGWLHSFDEFLADEAEIRRAYSKYVEYFEMHNAPVPFTIEKVIPCTIP